MYMKPFALLALLLLSMAASAQVPWMKGKTPVPYQKDTTKVSKPLPPPPDTLTATSVLFVNDTTLLAPSVYLRRAAKAQTFELVFTAAAAATALIGVASYNNNIYVMEDGTVNHLESSTGYYAVAGVFGALAIVNHIVSIHNTRRASESLSRFHLLSNGISIDL